MTAPGTPRWGGPRRRGTGPAPAAAATDQDLEQPDPSAEHVLRLARRRAAHARTSPSTED